LLPELYRKCRRCHFHLLSGDREAAAAVMAADNGTFGEEDSVAGTTRGVLEKTIFEKLQKFAHLRLGDKKWRKQTNRKNRACSLISSPRLKRFGDNGPPSMESSTPNMQPSPRISLTKSNLDRSFSRPARISCRVRGYFREAFRLRQFSGIQERRAQIIGSPPKVVPCRPARLALRQSCLSESRQAEGQRPVVWL